MTLRPALLGLALATLLACQASPGDKPASPAPAATAAPAEAAPSSDDDVPF